LSGYLDKLKGNLFLELEKMGAKIRDDKDEFKG
jgi:hypothetical protein